MKKKEIAVYAHGEYDGATALLEDEILTIEEDVHHLHHRIESLHYNMVLVQQQEELKIELADLQRFAN